MITTYLTSWRGIVIGGREYLEGEIAEAHRDPSAEFARELGEWDGFHYTERTPDGAWLVLVREPSPPTERWWLHSVLLILTILTTTLAGAALVGPPDILLRVPSPATLLSGLPFSLPLMGILCGHETGHYLMARRYRVNASPPYLIPFPPHFNLVGTMGAFIRLRAPVFDRRTLFDIGVAGPLAGMVIAIPVLVAGLAMSDVVPGATGLPLAHQFVNFDGTRVMVGDSLLLVGLRALAAPDGVLRLHPAAFAGWVGLLVTMLNLMPLAQLDGGHIAYALVGRGQLWVARAFWGVLLALGFLWGQWWLWAALALLLGRGRLGHPPVVSPRRALTPGRRLTALAAALLFALSFMPVPLPTVTP
ncbi:MAG: site-2 protease family protein [Gemmatimonadaceae bacterium]